MVVFKNFGNFAKPVDIIIRKCIYLPSKYISITYNNSYIETTSDFTFDNTAKQRQMKLYKVACWFVPLFVWIWI